jgi:hypothetical protein
MRWAVAPNFGVEIRGSTGAGAVKDRPYQASRLARNLPDRAAQHNEPLALRSVGLIEHESGRSKAQAGYALPLKGAGAKLGRRR